MYAIHGLNSRSWHGEIGRNEQPVYYTMMLEMWARKRDMGDEGINNLDDMSGYDKALVQIARVGWDDIVTVKLASISGLLSA